MYGLLSLIDYPPSKVIERHRRPHNSYKLDRTYDRNFFESPSPSAVRELSEINLEGAVTGWVTP